MLRGETFLNHTVGAISLLAGVVGCLAFQSLSHSLLALIFVRHLPN